MTQHCDTAREELIYEGLYGPVPLSSVNWHVMQLHRDATPCVIQQETMQLIRLLVADGLFELGYRAGEDDRFVAFNEPLDTSIQNIYDAYVTHNADRLGWVYRFWLDLSDKGKRVALSTDKGKQIAREEEERLAELQALRNIKARYGR